MDGWMGRHWKGTGLCIRAVQTQTAFTSASTKLETHSALSIKTTICGQGHSNMHLKIAKGLYTMYGQDESFYDRIVHEEKPSSTSYFILLLMEKQNFFSRQPTGGIVEIKKKSVKGIIWPWNVFLLMWSKPFKRVVLSAKIDLEQKKQLQFIRIYKKGHNHQKICVLLLEFYIHRCI